MGSPNERVNCFVVLNILRPGNKPIACLTVTITLDFDRHSEQRAPVACECDVEFD